MGGGDAAFALDVAADGVHQRQHRPHDEDDQRGADDIRRPFRPGKAARRAGGEHDAHHEEGKDGKEQPGKGDHFCSAVARHLVPLDFVAVFGLRDFKKDFGFFEGVGVSHDDGVLWDGWHSLHTR